MPVIQQARLCFLPLFPKHTDSGGKGKKIFANLENSIFPFVYKTHSAL